MLDFVLNGQAMQVPFPEPNQSILNWLRTDLGLMGSKEGCATGDCGACTVVIGDIQKDGQVRYQAVNGCITLANTLQGRHLLTVEGVGSKDKLHPCQQVMVDHHGTQCGYCTPGFVMSLFAGHCNGLDAQAMSAALGGNLCRCTGYTTIRDAATELAAKPCVMPFDPAEVQGALQQVKADSAANASASSAFVIPRTIEQAVTAINRYPDYKLVAGGTDLLVEMNVFHRRYPGFIWLGGIEGMQQIEENAGVVRFGAGVTFNQLMQWSASQSAPLHALLDRVAANQVRNQGTLGGNIVNASPVGDMPPVLLALDARIELTSAEGVRQMPLSDFFLGYRQTALQQGELLTAVIVPRAALARPLFIHKISKRWEDDIASTLLVLSATVADAGRLTDIHIGLGGMAATPCRATHTEQWLQQADVLAISSDELLAALGRDVQPMSDARASAQYRAGVTATLLKRGLKQLFSEVQKGGLSHA
ncbi:xanthine dehydrogenase small subunit [Pokkaliibacter plantistimulans]|nr:xanthine dehydrogenase small subunit [Pokkaliibacter plantistimulans]